MELRAQIDRAYAMGLVPTHLDSHMGCLFQTEELIEIYLKMGQVYKLPVLITNQIPLALIEKYDVKVILEDILTIMPEQYEKGPNDYYINAIKNLKSVGGNFYISLNDSLTSLDNLNNLSFVGGELKIGFNKSLVNLGGLNKITSVEGNLEIQNNTHLPKCQALGLKKQLEKNGWAGMAAISGNNGNCKP